VALKPGLGITRIDTIDPPPMTSYKRSIVTMGLSRTVSVINGDLVENRQFSHSVYLAPPLKGSPWNLVSTLKGVGKLEWRGYQMVEKVLR